MGIWTHKSKFGNTEPRIGRVIVTIVAVALLVMMVLSAIVIVPAGNVGVIDLFGNVSESELQSGLHLKHPFAGVEKMSTKTQEYTMSYTQGEGAKDNSDVISALTKEGLSVDLDMTVLYRLVPSKASDIYKTLGVGYVDIIVRPQIRTVIREVVVGFDAKEIYSEEGRALIPVLIFNSLVDEMLDRGIVLESVLLRHVQLPNQLTNAIEDKLTAEQNIEKRRFEVDIERQEADRKRIEAQGIADAQTIIDESLTPEYLRWYWIENLDTHNSVIYVPIDPEGMINLGTP